ncbi:MAG: sigma-70 family RNA polymerase sigma factor [Defluviitaleaceae bacterium]|nr:sigma-70 family RNA polymerase sigma factor [Defluviitaleaceae bacterium]
MGSLKDEKLVENFRLGDKQALDILLNRFKPLVKSKAQAYYVLGGDAEDLIQEGMIGLYKAVLDFDSSKNKNFAAFASLCIVRQIQTAIKAAGRQKHMMLNKSISLDNESHTFILPDPKINDPEALFLGREALRDAEILIKQSLSPLEYDVLMLHMDGKSHAEIAELLSKNKKSVDNTLQRIRKKIGLKISLK